MYIWEGLLFADGSKASFVPFLSLVLVLHLIVIEFCGEHRVRTQD